MELKAVVSGLADPPGALHSLLHRNAGSVCSLAWLSANKVYINENCHSFQRDLGVLFLRAASVSAPCLV